MPVVNALTDASHPCQVVADLLTVAERFGVDALQRGGLQVAWIGDGNNMANSWLEACALLGFELALACPPGYDPDAGLLARCAGRARLVRSPGRGGRRGPRPQHRRLGLAWARRPSRPSGERDFAGFIIDDALVARARPDAMVLHCLPAHRGEEISEAVLEGPRSAVFDQAENRLHGQKALLELLLADR